MKDNVRGQMEQVNLRPMYPRWQAGWLTVQEANDYGVLTFQLGNISLASEVATLLP